MTFYLFVFVLYWDLLNAGTGKTELAKAVAGESGAKFLLLSPSSLLSKFIGESERLLSKVFAFTKV